MTSPKKTKLEDEVEVMQVAKLSDKAIIPTKGSKLAAGYDLYSAYDYTIPASGKMLVKTDIQASTRHTIVKIAYKYGSSYSCLGTTISLTR